jgi:hypothetical protein
MTRIIKTNDLSTKSLGRKTQKRHRLKHKIIHAVLLDIKMLPEGTAKGTS